MEHDSLSYTHIVDRLTRTQREDQMRYRYYICMGPLEVSSASVFIYLDTMLVSILRQYHGDVFKALCQYAPAMDHSCCSFPFSVMSSNMANMKMALLSEWTSHTVGCEWKTLDYCSETKCGSHVSTRFKSFALNSNKKHSWLSLWAKQQATYIFCLIGFLYDYLQRITTIYSRCESFAIHSNEECSLSLLRMIFCV